MFGGQRYKRKIEIYLYVALINIFFLTACSFNSSNSNNVGLKNDEGTINTGFVVSGPESYDSADTALITKIDKENKAVTFLNFDVSKKYTLEYDGTTHFYDKYGQTISINQLTNGDIVDVNFLKSKKHIASIQIAADSWTNEQTTNYSIDNIKDIVSIGSEIYKLNKNILYFSEERIIDEMDINKADVLTFKGIGKDVYSVSIDKGHGYLRLKNDAAFVGGWIEIGQSIIQPITQDMLLTIPEGSYQVNVSNKGSEGTKSIVINRNSETTLDIGDIEISDIQYGKVLFSVTPDSTKIYIDGNEVDKSSPVELSYGIHQLIAKAEGYVSIKKYLNVGQESAGVDVILDLDDSSKDDEAEDKNESKTENKTDDKSDNKTDDKNETSDKDNDKTDNIKDENTETVTDYYKVYIDSPVSVEVYVDGNYVGISPCSFKKVEGVHDITLRKKGFETRSYTIQVDNEKKDFSYSFAELININ